MDQLSLIAWLRLIGAELKGRRAISLLESFSEPQAVFEATDVRLKAAGATPQEIKRLRNVKPPTEKQVELLLSGEVHLVPYRSDDYPANLKELSLAGQDVPVALFVRGTLCADDRFAVSIVGTRKSSPYGSMVAERLGRDLAASGLTLVSGGAHGIDTAAHRGALEAGGRTLAVLGCGVDVVYPADNRQLFENIARQGAVISEFPLGSPPDYWRFPIRNRTVSGMSLGVIVVEAPERSGALITAHCAAEQGRDVFVVPGSIDAPNSKGSHGLLKDGAALIDGAEDVLSALGITAAPREGKRPLPPLTDQQNRILNALSLEPSHPDALARQLGVPTHMLSTELTLMEVAGVARRLPGGSYIRVL